MLRVSIAFFILALLAYFLGAYGVAGLSMDIGKLLLVAFIIIAAISGAAALLSGRNSRLLR